MFYIVLSFLKKKHSFIYGCKQLSLVAASGVNSSLPCMGFALLWLLCGAQTQGTGASVVISHRLSSCSSRALECWLSSWLSCPGMWDFPRPRIKPVSPPLEGRFLPPGKSYTVLSFTVCFPRYKLNLKKKLLHACPPWEIIKIHKINFKCFVLLRRCCLSSYF